MISFVMRLLHTSIFTTVNDIRRDLVVWHLWNSWLLEANKNGDHLLIVLAFLFSLFCLLDWGHFTHRRFATRYEKRPCLFFALTLLAAILVWIP